MYEFWLVWGLRCWLPSYCTPTPPNTLRGLTSVEQACPSGNLLHEMIQVLPASPTLHLSGSPELLPRPPCPFSCLEGPSSPPKPEAPPPAASAGCDYQMKMKETRKLKRENGRPQTFRDTGVSFSLISPRPLHFSVYFTSLTFLLNTVVESKWRKSLKQKHVCNKSMNLRL